MPLLLLLTAIALAQRCVPVTAVAHVRRKAPAREKKAYDTSVRAFAPDGSIYQVEYALQAVDRGGLTIGVQTRNGLVLAAQGKRQSPLLKSESVSKILDIEPCMSCAMAGLTPDGLLLVDYARSRTQEHRFEFDEMPTVEAVTSQLSRLMLKFNGYGKDGQQGGSDEDDDLAMSRPFGVSLLLAGLGRGRPVLFHLEPSGAFEEWRAKAIGEKAAAAEAKLEAAGPFDALCSKQAMAAVLQVLRDVLADDFSLERLEMVCGDLSHASQAESDVMRPRQSQSSADVVIESKGASQDADNNVEGQRAWSKQASNGHSSREESSQTHERRRSLFRRVSRDEMEVLLSEPIEQGEL